MDKFAKIVGVIGIALIVIGAVMALGRVFNMFGWAETDVSTIRVPFDRVPERIYVNCVDEDVTVAVSDSGEHYLEYTQSSRVKYDVYTEDGISVTRKKSFSFGSFGEKRSVVIRVPAGHTGSVSVKTVSGDITVTGVDAETVWLNSTSGDISLSGSNSSGLAQLSSTSGDVWLTDSFAGEIDLSSVSGDISSIASDAPVMGVRSTSGDISLELASSKTVTASTVSGSMSLPREDTGEGTLTVRTVSGNIRVSVK